MNATTTYAVDTAKNVMQIHWVDADTGEIGRKKITRPKFTEFFAQRPGSQVVMEACGGSHHWARTLTALGHQVELLPTGQIRPFVRSNKDDAADAKAIWLAAQHGDIRRVSIKSCQQQSVLSMHRARKHWVDLRTATVNMLRGLLYEFGITLPVGKRAGLKALAERRAEIDPQLPAAMVRLVDIQLAAIREIEQHVDTFEAEIEALHKADETPNGCARFQVLACWALRLLLQCWAMALPGATDENSPVAWDWFPATRELEERWSWVA